MIDRLEPCPFCGSADVKLYDTSYNLHVFCCKCEAEGPSGVNKTESIALWNKRITPRKESMIDKLRILFPGLIQSKLLPWLWRDPDRGISINTTMRLICFERMEDCDTIAEKLGAAVEEKRNFSLIYREDEG